MSTNKKLDEIYKEIEELIEKKPEDQVYLTNIKLQIAKRKQQSQAKRSFYFVAEKGIGKTTIINYMLGLNYEKEKVNEKSGRSYQVCEEVLETGSGATTTSEVIICQNTDQKNVIKIEPYSQEESLELLETFAKRMFEDAHFLTSTERGKLEPELMRACRNLTGLTDNKKTKVDAAIELAKQYDSSQYDDFETVIINRANLANRTQLAFVCDDLKQPKEWIKKTFRKINLVHLDNAPLPKKIIVELVNDIFDFSRFPNVDKIIDTRGLEVTSLTDRTDIKEIFQSEKEDFIVFVDRFNAPSNSFITLLDHYVYDEKLDVADRICYLSNFRDGEPLCVLDTDGMVKDEIDGIEEKRNQAIQMFKENNLNFKYENIIYVNARRFLTDEGRYKVDEDDMDEFGTRENTILHKKDICREERESFLDEISNFIYEYDLVIQNKIENLIEKYETYKSKANLSYGLISDATSQFINENIPRISIEDRINSIYEDYLFHKHHSEMRAINNRYGIYWRYDIFCEGSNQIVKQIQTKLKKFKDKVVTVIYYSNTLDNDELLPAVEFLVDQLNRYFFKYIKEVGQYFNYDLKQNAFSENEAEFWTMAQSRWGLGSGYKNDMIQYYRNQLESKKYHETIDEKLKHIVETFVKGLLNIVEEHS